MSPRLADIFGELGISQYLDAFVDQGFDTWETILDITESDLDALGVKLGHRRKLQRRIANARGIAPTATLISPTRTNVEDTRNDAHRPDALASSAGDGREGGTQPVVQKRKYRRHPKPDQNAPERPPSAYVLFSNKMREDLKGQNLTFTEIAKLVGENWQGLTHAEKEPFERQAQTAKEKFTHDLAEYKKTPAYQKYLVYLQEFKAKYGDNKPQEKENAKRVRLSDPNIGEPSGIPTHVACTARAESVGELITGGEPPARRQRIDSLVSNGESCYAPSVVSVSQRTPGEDSTLASPTAGYFERRREPSPSFAVSPRDNSTQPPSIPARRDPTCADGPPPRPEPTAPLRHLPSFSDMFDGRPVLNGVPPPYPGEAPAPNFTILPRGYQTNSPALTPSTSGSESRPPSLMKEQSSAGSMSSGSGSSLNSYPRTPIEGPLPIHALLTGGGGGGGGKQFGSPSDSSLPTGPALYRSMSPDERGLPPYQLAPERARSESVSAGTTAPHPMGYYSTHAHIPNHIPPPPPNHIIPPIPSTRPGFSFGYNETRPGLPPVSAPPMSSSSITSPPASRPGGKGEAGLDGISALLQADKISDRRLV